MRTLDPYSLYLREGQWYLVGRDHDRDAIRTFRLSRIRGDVRFATRRERDFRTPADSTPTYWRDRASWQLVDDRRDATIRVSPEAAWQVERASSRHGSSCTRTTARRLQHALRRRSAAPVDARPRRPGGAARAGRARRRVTSALERVREPTRARRAHAAPTALVELEPAARKRVESPVAPERFAVLQAMMARPARGLR